MLIKRLFSPFIQQTNFPTGWYWYQFFFGGHQDKIKIISKYFDENTEILEVGCSVGNITHAFKEFKNIEYLGIDIDENAINYAKKHFAKKNINFQKINFKDINRKFDCILFSSLFHHIDDESVIDFLQHAKQILKNDGKIIVFDPLLKDNDHFFITFFNKYLEVGKWVRRVEHLKKLLLGKGELKIIHEDERLLSTFFRFPVIERFGLFILQIK